MACPKEVGGSASWLGHCERAPTRSTADSHAARPRRAAAGRGTMPIIAAAVLAKALDLAGKVIVAGMAIDEVVQLKDDCLLECKMLARRIVSAAGQAAFGAPFACGQWPSSV